MLATGGGPDGNADPIARNKAISRAYGELYQAKPELEWSGLAAIASAQAGCTLVQVKPIAAMAGVSQKAGSPLGPQSPESAGAGLGTAIWDRAGQEAAVIERGTADTNKTIFSDIYPPRVPVPLQAAFHKLATNPRGASNDVAAYEQNMVQARIYDKRPELMSAMKDVQRYSNMPVIGWLGGQMFSLRKPEIPVSAACEGATPVPLDGDITVAQDRIRYYGTLMNEMERQQRQSPGTLGGTIQAIINRGR